jgi:hypothetical protein
MSYVITYNLTCDVDVLQNHRQFENAHHCGLTAPLVDVDVSQNGRQSGNTLEGAVIFPPLPALLMDIDVLQNHRQFDRTPLCSTLPSLRTAAIIDV